MSRSSLPVRLLRQLTCILLCLLIIAPFAVISVNSLKDRADAAVMALTLPRELVWENYSIAIERGRLALSFLNSLLYAGGGTAGAILVTSLAAYVLSRRRTPFTRFLYFFICLGIVLPGNFVTLIKVMQVLHLINTRWGIVLLYMAGSAASATFIIYGFISSVPREMDESAAIDGARPLRLFFSIVFPLLQPVMITVAILSFLGIWNDFVTPLYVLNRSSAWPMTLSIYGFFGRFQQDWNLVFADMVLTTLPVVIVYLVGQKSIVSGMIAGAVKG